MTLRAATADDLPRLVELAVAFYAEDGFATPEPVLSANLRVLLGSPDRARVALAVADGQVAGFSITTTTFGLEYGLGAELEDLYVVPARRRQGLARDLIEDSAAWAASIGASQLEIVIAPNGQDVSHLFRYYTARGFTDDGRRLLNRRLQTGIP